jgi:hypothetical protein
MISAESTESLDRTNANQHECADADHPEDRMASDGSGTDRACLLIRGPDLGSHRKMLTARAITSPRMNREVTACTVMAALAQRASGITSVGLNAVALVKPR